MIGAGAAIRHRVGRRTAGQLAGVLAVAVLAGVAAGAGAHLLLTGGAGSTSAVTTVRHGPLWGQATWAAGVRPAPAITTLRDQSGARFSLSSLRGRPVAIEFFDSHCKAECPLAGRALAASERSLPAAQRPVLVVVSVNPKDTAASVRAAIRSWGLGVAPWHWLMGSHAQLAPVWAAYRVFVQPTRGDISHTEALYLLDRRGDERSGYLFPYLPASVAHDMRVLAGRAGGERA